MYFFLVSVPFRRIVKSFFKRVLILLEISWMVGGKGGKRKLSLNSGGKLSWSHM